MMYFRISTFCFIVSGLILYSCTTSSSTARSPDPGTGILFVSDRASNMEIYLIQPDGTGLTRLTNHIAVDSDPSWSPDGLWVIYRSRMDGSSDIFQMRTDGSDVQNLIKDPEDSFYDEFSPKINPNGERIALISDRFPVIGNCQAGVHHLAFMPRSGGAENILNFTALSGEQAAMSWSPDGLQLAFTSVCNETISQIYLFNIETNEIIRLTDREHQGVSPDWSPDGKKIAYVSSQLGNQEIFIIDIDSGEVINLTDHPANDSQPSWSPDGNKIAFTTNRDGNKEIYVMDIDGSNAVNITNNPASDFLPAWSPIKLNDE